MNSESKSRVLYENLDTTFVNLWALLRKLSQGGFIGRVHVELKDYTADVFMTGSSTPLVHEIDRAAGTERLEETALHRLVLRVRETPGTITVFEGADEAVAVQATAVSENRPEESDSIAKSEMNYQSMPQAPESALDEASLVIESPAEPGLTDADAKAQGPDRNPATQLVEPALPLIEPVDEIEWAAIIKASGELVGGVERALSGPGADFNSLFDGARLELADDYTFLDPMSGEFTYSDSVVTLGSELPVGSYVIGLSETLRRMVDAVAIGDRARRVRERVALELLSVARKRREILERSGFLSQLDRIAGTKVL
ncbi:MAG: hypothetical protein QOH71_4569 [Blastocatellia bacterium]|jgi:hypothetical protein|nr:hypothetical protein [Blastocatellia bacterium]